MASGHLSFSAEQDQFRDIIARFLATHSPTSEVRRVMAGTTGFDPALWRKLCHELALSGLHIAESYGGSGFGMVEVGIAMEELGRSLTPCPYFASSVLASSAILAAGDEDQKQQLLPDIISGECLATLAFDDLRGTWDSCAVEAERKGEVWLLNGSSDYVIDGVAANLIVVAARAAGKPGLFVLSGDAAGSSRNARESLDATRRLARLEFAGAAAERLAGDAEAALNQTLNVAAIALACEMVGGAQAMLDAAVSYARLRVQFGRTISSFQAIKHKCADVLLEVESARSAAYVAAAAAGDPELSALASLAKVAASQAFINAATACIQIHGGIGFTWENDTHLWFRRAKVCEMLLGDNAYHRERMLQAWGI